MYGEKEVTVSRKTTCAECGGTLAARTSTHSQPWDTELYRFEDVPAHVCEQCGRVWLSAEVSQRIDATIRGGGKPKKYEKVPVFSLADLVKA